MNELFFPEAAILSDIKTILENILSTDIVLDIFKNDITLIGDDNKPTTLKNLPALYYSIGTSNPLARTATDNQIQNHTDFMTLIEIYTDGIKRATDARLFGQEIISGLQKYNFRLIDQHLDSTYTATQARYIIRFRNLFDNTRQKIIF